MPIGEQIRGEPIGRPAGVIHDIGYQRYTGVRLGRGYATRSLYVHGVRTVFGLGRGAKSKVFPWFATAGLMLFAVVDVAVRAQTGVMPIHYLDLANDGVLLVLLFIATTAPELVSRDLRNKTLPLYFSRPLGRVDYALAKLGALATGVFAVLAAPMVVIFAGGAFSLDGGHAVWHEFTDFLGGLALAVIIAIVDASIALLIASLLRRSAVATAVIAGYFLLTAAVGGAVESIIGGTTGTNIGHMFSPPDIVDGLKQWIFRIEAAGLGDYGPVYLAITVVMTGLAIGLLLLRYRKVTV